MEEEKTKKQIQAAKNMEMLKRKKAEVRVALINKSIDEKIQSMKDDNFQRAQITAQISKDHQELMAETAQSIQKFANREKDKRPDIDGEEWTDHMPSHWWSGDADDASSIIQNHTNTATVVTISQATKAGVRVNEALETIG